MKKAIKLVFEPSKSSSETLQYSRATTPSGARITEVYDGDTGSLRYFWTSTKRELTIPQLKKYGLWGGRP